MNKIARAFSDGKAFIPFITCGDPDLETTKALVLEMEKAGADLIELGIPFSDPTAEGPVIEAASLRALQNGTTTDRIFEMVESLRKETDIPLVFMTYANVIFSYGTDRFMKRAAELGIDGLILPDIPYEEKEEFLDACNECDIALISMIAPTSKQRISKIAAEAKGFIYIVSSMGVTGARSDIQTDLGEIIREIRKATDVPCAIGFGIHSPEQAAKMAEMADGVIVGSAIVNLAAEHKQDCLAPVGAFVREMKQAIA